MEIKTKMTPPQLARRWGVSPDKIVFFILTGELRAIDASLKRGTKPRYLIDVADVEAFEAARTVVPAVKPAGRKNAFRAANSGKFY